MSDRAAQNQSFNYDIQAFLREQLMTKEQLLDYFSEMLIECNISYFDSMTMEKKLSLVENIVG